MALFKTIEDLQAVIGISDASILAKILPKCEQAEAYFLRKKILGPVLYGNLISHFESDSLTPQEAHLLPFAQSVSAFYAYAIGFGIFNVSITSAGIRQAHTEDYKPAFEWAYDEAKKDILFSAYRATEELLNFLEENVADYQATWQASPAFFQKRNHFVQSAIEFDSCESSIKENRRYYLDVLGILDEVEDLIIRPNIGEAYWQYLKTMMKAGTPLLTVEDKEVYALLQKSIVKTTFGRSAKEMDLQHYEINVTHERAEASIKAGENYLVKAIEYLNNTASSNTLAVYFNSSNYKAPPRPNSDFVIFKNDKKRRIFVK